MKEQGDYQDLPGDDSVTKEDSPPKDRFGFVWMLALIFGIGQLFPWNAFITAYDYFSEVYGEDSHFEFIFGIVYNTPALLGLVWLLIWGKNVNPFVLCFVSYSIQTIVILFVPLWRVFEVDDELAKQLIYASVGISGGNAAILFGSVMSIFSNFPFDMRSALMAGQGMAGILVAIIRISTKISIPNEYDTAAVVYFAAGAFILFLCVIGTLVLKKAKYARHYLALAEKEKERQPIVSVTSDEESADPEAEEKKASSFLHVLGKTLPQAMIVWVTFFITLALFPGLILETEAEQSFWKDGWYQICLVATFIVFDFIGRYIPKYVVVFSPKNLWTISYARLIFFPLFIIMVKPHIITKDWTVFAILAIFAFTNGYASTLGMMFGPTQVKDADKSVSAVIMTCFLNGGIICGNYFAVALLYFVKGELPF